MVSRYLFRCGVVYRMTRIEIKVIYGFLTLMIFLCSHIIQSMFALTEHLFFMGLLINNLLLDILIGIGCIIQLCLIILIIRDEINGSSK